VSEAFLVYGRDPKQGGVFRLHRLSLAAKMSLSQTVSHPPGFVAMPLDDDLTETPKCLLCDERREG